MESGKSIMIVGASCLVKAVHFEALYLEADVVATGIWVLEDEKMASVRSKVDVRLWQIPTRARPSDVCKSGGVDLGYQKHHLFDRYW